MPKKKDYQVVAERIKLSHFVEQQIRDLATNLVADMRRELRAEIREELRAEILAEVKVRLGG